MCRTTSIESGMASETNNTTAETSGEGQELKDFEEVEDATWGEVFDACCNNSTEGWINSAVSTFSCCFVLYFFLVGLDLLGSSAKVLGGCTAGEMFGEEQNPVAGLMVGILATVLLQSSSTTTSVIVGLVSGDIISTKSAIYMIMGANIGTSVTSTIVAMGQLGDSDQLERAFAGATVHDMFNFLSVLVLLPLEVITGYLFKLTSFLVPDEVADGDKWEGPVKKLVSPVGSLILKANKKVIKKISTGEVGSCEEFYPTFCEGGIESYETCTKVGLIACDKKSGKCPLFFHDGATQSSDETSGAVVLFISLALLIVCLVAFVALLQRIFLGTSKKIMYKATNIHPVLAILVGTGLTILVQSSSITTSALTPLCGVGVISLERMLPLTLGANIGTTVTALLAASVSDSVDSLQVALAHLCFNLTGILIWYPSPSMRQIPLNAARFLGRTTRVWRLVPLVYILVAFFIFPLLILGISNLIVSKEIAYQALGAILFFVTGVSVAYGLYWLKYCSGGATVIALMRKREERRKLYANLQKDLDYLKSEVARLRDHANLPDIEMANKDV